MKKQKLNSFLVYLLATLLPIACFVILMIIKECYPFGENTILIVDLDLQYSVYLNTLVEKISDGSSLLYNFNSGLGENFFAAIGYYLASPFCWLILLFGTSHLELGTTCIFLLETGLVGGTTCYYFRHSKINKLPKGRLNDALCILFSLSFAMCDYLLAYGHNIIWLTPLALMPLMLLGIERLVDTGDFRLYVVSLFLIFITNFYYAWFMCLMAVLWFVDQKKESFKAAIKSFWHFALYSILAALSACAILIPCYYQSLIRDDMGWYKISDYTISTICTFGNFFVGLFWGYEFDTEGVNVCTNNNYCGIFVIFLVFAFLFVANISKKQRIKRFLEIVILAILMNWVYGSAIMHGMSIPHSICTRFAFMFIFLGIVTAFEALPGLENLRIRHGIAVVGMFIVAIVAMLLTASVNDVQSIFCYLVTLLIFVYLSLCFILYKRKSIKLTSLYINILIIGFAELIGNFFFNGDLLYGEFTYNTTEVAEWSQDYKDIETEDGERKTARISYYMAYYYTDSDTYSSTINTKVATLYKKLGLGYLSNGCVYAYIGSTPLTAALFNIDYVLTTEPLIYGGYAGETNYTTSSGTSYGVLETEYDTELAFMISENVSNWNLDAENCFEVQNSFTSDVLGVGDIFQEYTPTDVYAEGASMILLNYDANSCEYMDFNLTGETLPELLLQFTVEEDMDLYVHFQDDFYLIPHAYVNGELVVSGLNTATESTISIQGLKAGDEVVLAAVIIYSSAGETGNMNFTYYKFNSDVMEQCVDIMNSSTYNITSFSDTYISGTVTATQETPVLYTSIPYYKGWTVYVDGVATDVTVIGDAFIGVELEAGDHVVEFKYFPYGLKLGIILSILGIALVSIFWIKRNKKGAPIEEVAEA